MISRILCLIVACSMGLALQAQQKQPARSFYALRIYHFTKVEQEKRLLQYLEAAYVPAIHRTGVKTVGVFESRANDTSAQKTVYVLVPFDQFGQWNEIDKKLEADAKYREEAADYLETPSDRPVYDRMELILMHAFAFAPRIQSPLLQGPKEDRVYELRSYESASEALFRNKVHMFNEGGEIALFKRLNFNAIFYGEVLSGAHMPNLMYMTSFENQADRDAHWKRFVDDAEWKTLSAKPEYKGNVSHIDIRFLRPLEFSDL